MAAYIVARYTICPLTFSTVTCPVATRAFSSPATSRARVRTTCGGDQETRRAGTGDHRRQALGGRGFIGAISEPVMGKTAYGIYGSSTACRKPSYEPTATIENPA